MKKTHIIGLVVIAAAIAVLISMMADVTSYETIASAKQKAGKTVTVIAKLDSKTIRYDPALNPNYLTFDAVDTLPEQCRKVIKMTFEEGKKPKEIALALGITISTVNNQKMRGLNLLKDRLPGDQLSLGLFMLAPTLISHLK